MGELYRPMELKVLTLYLVKSFFKLQKFPTCPLPNRTKNQKPLPVFCKLNSLTARTLCQLWSLNRFQILHWTRLPEQRYISSLKRFPCSMAS